ncbi:MAG: transport permease protein [Candidatus Hydrogenedentota bacterium]
MSHATYSSAQQWGVDRVVPDLIRSRGLLWDLVWKDLRARYRNTIMGFVWAVLQPLMLMLILTFVFSVIFPGKVEGVDGGSDHPFHVTLLCGLIFWQFFATSLGRCTNSLLDNHDLVKKVYFPREVVPIAAMGNAVVNLLIGFVVLLIIHLLAGGSLGLGIVWLPIVFAVQFTLVLGLALLCSSLNVYYRDVAYMVDVVLTLGFYATPLFYPLAFVRDWAAGVGSYGQPLLTLYMMNPMVGFVEAYRQCILDGVMPDLALLAWPAICAAVFLIAGAVVFRRNAPVLADYL